MTESSPPPTPTDNLMGRVIYLVGTVLILSLVGTIVLALFQVDPPKILEWTVTGSLGGLLALLAGKRSS